jgi:hypothetical protein
VHVSEVAGAVQVLATRGGKQGRAFRVPPGPSPAWVDFPEYAGRFGGTQTVLAGPQGHREAEGRGEHGAGEERPFSAQEPPLKG